MILFSNQVENNQDQLGTQLVPSGSAGEAFDAAADSAVSSVSSASSAPKAASLELFNYAQVGASEEQIESGLIAQLKTMGYEYLGKNPNLEENLLAQIIRLNKLDTTADYWQSFKALLVDKIAQYCYPSLEDQVRHAKQAWILIVQEGRLTFEQKELEEAGCPDSLQEIMLLDLFNLDNNQFQVCHQYETTNNLFDGLKNRKSRFDTTVLINGLPLVHIELKKPTQPAIEAFGQVVSYYKDESFANTLYTLAQIFVVSNGIETRYFSNTIPLQLAIENRKDNNQASYQFTNFWTDFHNNQLRELPQFVASFFDRQVVLDLLTRYATITNLHYPELPSTHRVMRPYQYYATKAILKRIAQSEIHPEYITKRNGNGYIWHSTGSGKTFTSYKAATLALEYSRNGRRFPIQKVLLVVDRNELYLQTAREYASFDLRGETFYTDDAQELRQCLLSKERSAHVTTIHKLEALLRDFANEKDPARQAENEYILKQRTVFIFDECHRSQHGKMHADIKNSFSNYNFFGLTGTPIFSEEGNNELAPLVSGAVVGAVKSTASSGAQAGTSANPNPKKANGELIESDELKKFAFSTEYVFGDCLHSYNMGHAIKAGTVLPFHTEFYTTHNDGQDEYVLEDGETIDQDKTWLHPDRVHNVALTLLQDFPRKTLRDLKRPVSDQRAQGFNGIFAVHSIKAAQEYYTKFKQLIQKAKKDVEAAATGGKSVSDFVRFVASLRVTTIFSTIARDLTLEATKSKKVVHDDFKQIVEVEHDQAANQLDQAGDLVDFGQLETEVVSDKDLSQVDRDFLTQVMQDYDEVQGTNVLKGGFKVFYDDLMRRMRGIKDERTQKVERKIDLLIVVNMFLTGFDAPGVNTLWVDRPLYQHGLIQAMSRTNRLCNELKNHGNIVFFRNLKEQVEQAVDRYCRTDDGVRNDLIRPSYQAMLLELVTRYQQVQELCTQYDLLSADYVTDEEVAKEFMKRFSRLYRHTIDLQTYQESYQTPQQVVSQDELTRLAIIYKNTLHRHTVNKTKVDTSALNQYSNSLIDSLKITPEYLAERFKQIKGGVQSPQQLQALKELEQALAAAPEREHLHEAFVSFTKECGVDLQELNRNKIAQLEQELALLKQQVAENEQAAAAVLPTLNVSDFRAEFKGYSVDMRNTKAAQALEGSLANMEQVRNSIGKVKATPEGVAFPGTWKDAFFIPRRQRAKVASERKAEGTVKQEITRLVKSFSGVIPDDQNLEI